MVFVTATLTVLVEVIVSVLVINVVLSSFTIMKLNIDVPA